jgi:hypothetical protein
MSCACDALINGQFVRQSTSRKHLLAMAARVAMCVSVMRLRKLYQHQL